MARRIANSTLNASTLDILNVIRQNASYEYQQAVPQVTSAVDIPKVGEVIYGTPALANQFINALVNRIAIVRVQSATFNNPYSILKKGYLEFGETIEDIFVNIAKVVEYTPEKGAEREFKRTLPDVRSAFHVMNWRVMYPVTIQDDDLKLAFLSIDGVTNLIAKIVDSVYTAAEYDEFLLFKYLLIKAISSGKMKPDSIGTTFSENAVEFRGISNLLPFMSSEYNEAGVKTTTPKDRQVIFMDAKYNAQFDVNVLASAFNMDKADFMGRLFLIDDWTSFDNERFEVIRANSDGIEEVTEAELALLENVKACILDENWFQVYDNHNKFTEDYVAAGLYWNYFYHVWKTVSNSPFANAVVFVDPTATITDPASLTFRIANIDEQENGDVTSTMITLEEVLSADTLEPHNYQFMQDWSELVGKSIDGTTVTEQIAKGFVTRGIAIHPYGAIMYNSPPSNVPSIANLITGVIVKCGNSYYLASTELESAEVGDTVNFSKLTVA